MQYTFIILMLRWDWGRLPLSQNSATFFLSDSNTAQNGKEIVCHTNTVDGNRENDDDYNRDDEDGDDYDQGDEDDYGVTEIDWYIQQIVCEHMGCKDMVMNK